MVSNRGRPLSPETKKAIVSVKQYFDANKVKPKEPIENKFWTEDLQLEEQEAS
jgi:hypothetical protein